MAVVVGDIVRIVAVFQWAAQDIFSNIYHFQVGKNDTVDDTQFMERIADMMNTAYLTVNGNIGDNINYVDVEGINLTQDILLPPTAWPSLTTGAGGSQSLPTQVAASVYFRTLRPRTRASKFLPPFTETFNDPGGLITAAAQADMQAFGDAWVDGIADALVEVTLGAYNIEAARFTPVALAIVAPRFRTQRRRRLGVGS